jgi:hypothetical protein
LKLALGTLNEEKRFIMSNLKDRLILLGSDNPDLRSHLRPVLDRISSEGVSPGERKEYIKEVMQVLSDSLSSSIMTQGRSKAGVDWRGMNKFSLMRGKTRDPGWPDFVKEVTVEIRNGPGEDSPETDLKLRAEIEWKGGDTSVGTIDLPPVDLGWADTYAKEDVFYKFTSFFQKEAPYDVRMTEGRLEGNFI